MFIFSLFTFAVIIFGVILLLVSANAIAEVRFMRRNGLVAKGTVVEMDGNFVGERPVFAFETEAGRQIKGVAKNVKRGRYAFTVPGATMDIYYLPSDPNVFIVYQPVSFAMVCIAAGAGAVIAVAGLASFIL